MATNNQLILDQLSQKSCPLFSNNNVDGILSFDSLSKNFIVNAVFNKPTIFEAYHETFVEFVNKPENEHLLIEILTLIQKKTSKNHLVCIVMNMTLVGIFLKTQFTCQELKM